MCILLQTLWTTDSISGTVFFCYTDVTMDSYGLRKVCAKWNGSYINSSKWLGKTTHCCLAFKNLEITKIRAIGSVDSHFKHLIIYVLINYGKPAWSFFEHHSWMLGMKFPPV